ncbi:hypothetical protein P3S67_002076 [Capsicum chacoense]
MSSSVNLSPILEISKFEEQDRHREFVNLGQYGNQLRKTGGKKNEKDATANVVGEWAHPRRRRHYRQSQAQVHTQALYNHSQNPLYFISPPPYLVYCEQPYVQLPSYSQWRAPTPQGHPPTPQTCQVPSRPDVQSKSNNKKRQNPRDSFTPISESYASLFQRLLQWGMTTLLLGYTPDPHSRSFDPNVRCAYHSDFQGHNIEDCRALKREIEKMIQDKLIMVQTIDSERSSSRADMQTSG